MCRGRESSSSVASKGKSRKWRQFSPTLVNKTGLWVHTFDTIEELRRGLQDFVAHYNATWLVARHGNRTPNQIRAEQRRPAQCLPAHLPLAA
jgi:putative transposase